MIFKEFEDQVDAIFAQADSRLRGLGYRTQFNLEYAAWEQHGFMVIRGQGVLRKADLTAGNDRPFCRSQAHAECLVRTLFTAPWYTRLFQRGVPKHLRTIPNEIPTRSSKHAAKPSALCRPRLPHRSP